MNWGGDDLDNEDADTEDQGLTDDVGASDDAFERSIVEQESGGSYGAVGPAYRKKDGSWARRSLGERALGKYQVVPKFWFDKIGLNPTSLQDQQRFLASPALQKQAFDIVMADGRSRYGNDPSKLAANYYGGAGAASIVGTPAADKPQSAGMPSVNQYAQSVTSRLTGNAAPSQKPWEMNWGGSESAAPAQANPATPDAPTQQKPWEMAWGAPPAEAPAPTPTAQVAPTQNPPMEAPKTPFKLPGFGTYPDPNQAPKLDPKAAASKQRRQAVLEGKGAEYYQAQAEMPLVKPPENLPTGPFTGTLQTQTPEAYQAQKTGIPRSRMAGVGDLEKTLVDHWTGLLANTLENKGTFEAAGERMERTEATLKHKLALEQAKAKQASGKPLEASDEEALKNDPSFWQEIGDMARSIKDDPAGTAWGFLTQMVRDMPTLLLSSKAIDAPLELYETTKAAKALKVAQEAKVLPQATKVSKIAATAKTLGRETAQNVGSVAAVNYPQAAAMGEDYGAKEGARDVLTGAVLTGATHLKGKLAKTVMEAPKPAAVDATGKAPEAPGVAPAKPQDPEKVWRDLQNVALIADIRKKGLEAGIPSDHIENFLQAHKYELQQTDEPLEFMVEKLKREEKPQDVVHVGDRVFNALLKTGENGGRKLVINEADKRRLGLYEGPALNASDMQTKDAWRNMGVPVEFSKTAPKLEEIAHSLLMAHEEDKGVRARTKYIGVDKPDMEYGFSADDLATALINRPRGKEALEREIADATKGQDQASYDREQEEAWNRLSPEERAAHQKEWAEGVRNEPAPVDEGLPDEHASPLALNPDFEALRKEYGANSPENGLKQTGPRKLLQTGAAKPEAEAKPIFYSQLQRMVESKMPNAMGPESLRNMLKANAVKDDEIKWTGLDDLLKGKEKVTKQDVLNHLAENQVQVEEVHKADLTRRDAGGEQAFAEEGDDGRWHVYGEAANERDVYATEREAKEKAAQYNRDLPSSPTNFGDYQEPGGKNYRELLLTLPEKDKRSQDDLDKTFEDLYARVHRAMESGDEATAERLQRELNALPKDSRKKASSYHSGHWEEPNVLAHVRFNDRVTPEGKKVLHLEEVQSDWHQAGRKKGYQWAEGEMPTPEQAKEFFGISDEAWAKFSPEDRQSYADEIFEGNQRGDRYLKEGGAVPNAPFKKTWHEMALRRMLRYAAENGYDYLTWTGGEKQAARYDLSKQVDRITVNSPSDGLYEVYAVEKGSRVGHKIGETMDAAKLEATVGKDIASKAVEAIRNSKDPRFTAPEYTGDDLKVGGEGMRGFYDKIVPDYLNKYAKKWGSKTQEVKAAYEGSSIRAHDQTFQGIPVTPEMKASVMEGQPLFQRTEDVPKGSYHFDERLKKHVISLVKGQADMSTLFHEYFHYLEQGGVLSYAERNILENALRAYGIQNPTDDRGRFTSEAAEKAARWYERWLRDGGAREPALKPVFDKISEAMKEIYQSTRGTELTAVPTSVAKVFKGMPEWKDVPTENQSPVRLEQGKNEFPEPKFGKPSKEPPPILESDNFMTRQMKKLKDPNSGFLTRMEKFNANWFNKALAIEKVQKIYEHNFQTAVPEESDLSYALNDVYGAGGRAKWMVDHELNPIVSGGEFDGVKYEKLTPEQQHRMATVALARDALWRVENADGYAMPNNLTRGQAEKIVAEHNAKGLASQAGHDEWEKVEHAITGLIAYSKKLAYEKVKRGMWSAEDYGRMTKNPHYIPEIRNWGAKLASPAKSVRSAKSMEFGTTNTLRRRNKATDEDVPVFHPVISLIHDTYQMEVESAKAQLMNKVIDLAETDPEFAQEHGFQRVTNPEEQPKRGYEHVKALRPRDVHLTKQQEALAKKLDDARFSVKNWTEGGTLRDEMMAATIHKGLYREVQHLPRDRRQHLGETVENMVRKLAKEQTEFNKTRYEKAKKFLDEEWPKTGTRQERALIEDFLAEGKPITYRVPIEFKRAVDRMDPLDYHGFFSVLQKTANSFRKGTVTWNPAFMFINILRDLQEAYINTGMHPGWAFGAINDIRKESPVYKEFIENGGSMEGDESGFAQASDQAQKILYHGERYGKLKDPHAWDHIKSDKIRKGLKVWHWLTQTGKAVPEGIEHLGGISEMATRVGVYKYARAKGLSPKAAIDMSRNGTFDFRKSGAVSRVLNPMIPFLNARLQGTARSVKPITNIIREPKSKANQKALGTMAARLAIASSLPMGWWAMMNLQNPYYSEINERDKKYYWTFMLGPNTRKHIKIPKSANVQLLLNPIQMGWESHVGAAHESPWKIMKDTFLNLSPIEEASSLMPPLAKEIMEQGFNKDTYWDRDIVTDTNAPDSWQWNASTSETMKAIAKGMRWLPDDVPMVSWFKSPQRMQHMTQSMLGGTSNNILFLTDAILGMTPFAESKAWNVKRIPIASRFYGEVEDWQATLEMQNRELHRKLRDAGQGYNSSQNERAAARTGQTLTEEELASRNKDAEAKYQKIEKALTDVTTALDALHRLQIAIEQRNPEVKRRFMHQPTVD